MANKVSFIIQLKDKYSAAARVINTANEKMKRGLVKVKAKVDQLGLSLAAFGRKAAKTGAIMSATITLPLLLLSKKMVDAASAAEETADKFKVVFSGVSDQSQKAARGFAKSFKLAQSTADDMLGSTGDLLIGFGFLEEKALQMSLTVGKFALDLAAFQDRDPAEIAKALTGALSGETEALKSLGIVINQNNPKFKESLKLNLRAVGGDLIRGRALTILQEAMVQAGKAQDNYLDTIGTFAGQQRVASEATKQLNESMGVLLLPTATKVAQAITKISDKVSELSPGTQKMIILFGLFLAVAGPLLVIAGLLALAFTAVSFPILAIVVAIALAVSGMVLFFDEISAVITKVKELFFETSFGRLVGGAINLFSNAAPSAPVNGGGSLNGDILVSASPGSKVESTRLQTKGQGFNVGMNVAGSM